MIKVFPFTQHLLRGTYVVLVHANGNEPLGLEKNDSSSQKNYITAREATQYHFHYF